MILILSVRLLDGRFHGRANNGERPDWPPSCFRLFQAIVAGNAQGESIRPEVVEALKWLESLAPPLIVVPAAKAGRVMLTYVLNNTEGRSRTPKVLRPTLLNGDRLVEFAWQYDTSDCVAHGHAGVLLDAVRHIRAFGWGIDVAIGHGAIKEHLPEPSGSRLRFFPREQPDAPGAEIRVPTVGSMDSLSECFRQYLGRFESGDSTYLESGSPLYKPWSYIAGIRRPYAVFKLLDENDDTVSYPQAKLIHIAGMVRRLAHKMMKDNPPRNLRGRGPDEWLRSYVMGHQSAEDKATDKPHTQFSYVPLQSIGMEHTDPAVRRVMIIAPISDEEWLEHLATQVDGEPLEPLPGTKLPSGTRLERIRNHAHDGVRDRYQEPSSAWATVTPVILDGHIKKKRVKNQLGQETEVTNHVELIRRALARGGIEQPCEFEWSSSSRFRKMLSAYKYRRDPADPSKKMRIDYIRPDHLMDNSAVHLVLRFGSRENPEDESSRWIPASVPVPGPITLGAGRHCGFGVLARIDD